MQPCQFLRFFYLILVDPLGKKCEQQQTKNTTPF